MPKPLHDRGVRGGVSGQCMAARACGRARRASSGQRREAAEATRDGNGSSTGAMAPARGIGRVGGGRRRRRAASHQCPGSHVKPTTEQ
jgi:hypothetical protein